MGGEISQRDLRNDSGEVLRRVEAGERFTVTRNGTPVAELVPQRRSRFVPIAAVVELFATAPPIDAARFFADLAEAADQDAAPRA